MGNKIDTMAKIEESPPLSKAATHIEPLKEKPLELGKMSTIKEPRALSPVTTCNIEPAKEKQKEVLQSQTTSIIEPIKEKRLELGKKVFKVPTESKRKSSRIQRPVEKFTISEPTELFHNLFLAPTRKRQRKKMRERERKRQKSRKKIHISDVFTKKRKSVKRRHAGDKMITIILDDAELRLEKKTRKISDLVRIRHLARCGGVQSVSGLEDFFEAVKKSGKDSKVPPPFETKDDDPYITPEPGQLISYLWHTRPSPLHGKKHIYRTGILCATDGTMRFFESDDDCVENNNKNRKFYQGRFYLNKQVFKAGNFRVRTDLVEGAICYERDRKLPCKILKIDDNCGAVLIESLEVEESGKKQIWIAPDDLVGSYDPNECQNVEGQQPSKPSMQDPIDLTEDDEDEMNFASLRPVAVSTVSPRQVSADSLSEILGTNPASLTDIEAQRKSVAAMVADVCESIVSSSTPSALRFPRNGYNRCGDNSYNKKFGNTFQKQQFNPGTRSNLPRFGNGNFRTPDISRSTGGATLGSPIIGQTLPNNFGTAVGSSNLISPHTAVTAHAELELLKQHEMALEMLMSANDVATIVASLQHIKRMHQRGVPMGPTATKMVAEAELTSRTLVEDGFWRHMKTPIWSGGKGYNDAQAGMILCRLAPVLGSNLGRLDSPLIDATKLLTLGLSAIEAMDVLPYIQSIEESIMMKNLSLKRMLTTANIGSGNVLTTSRDIFNSYTSMA